MAREGSEFGFPPGEVPTDRYGVTQGWYIWQPVREFKKTQCLTKNWVKLNYSPYNH